MAEFTNLNPADGEKNVAPTRPIFFTTTLGGDGGNLTMFVRGIKVINSNSPITGWATFEVTEGEGSRILGIYPTDPAFQWGDGELIEVFGTIKPSAGSQISETVSWSFNGLLTAEQPFSIYRMIMRSIRQHDERSPGILQRLIQGEGGIDDLWKSNIFDPATLLPTLFEPDNIDDKWIPWMLAQVGFTRDISFEATETELRRIIPDAVRYWNAKPSEDVLNKAIRLVTGNRFRIRNFFDLVLKTDESRITESLENLDPNTLVTEIVDVSGTKLTTSGAPVNKFAIADLALPNFKAEDEYHTLVVEGHSVVANGIFPIKKLDIGAKTGEITGVFSAATATEGPWKLLGVHSDFTIEIRLVDQAIGSINFTDDAAAFGVGVTIKGASSGATAIITAIVTGPGGTGTLTLRKIRGRFVSFEDLTTGSGGSFAGKATDIRTVSINRNLVEFLLNLPRTSSERFDLVYITFLDQFLTPLDLDQWTLAGSGSATVPKPGGVLLMSGFICLFAAIPDAISWDDQNVVWKLQGAASATARARLFFASSDVSNYYYVEVIFGTSSILPGSIQLKQFLAGAPSSLSSVISVPAIVPDVDFTVRVDMLKDGSDTRLIVRVDGDEFIDFTDSPGTFQKGTVGIDLTDSPTPTIKVKLIEVMNLPIEVNRVGRNP